jgi:hypothetical protein
VIADSRSFDHQRPFKKKTAAPSRGSGKILKKTALEDAAMTPDYSSQIEQATSLFTDAILSASPELSTDALEVGL